MTNGVGVGVGIVGCGGMGAWHARNLAVQPGIEVRAVADAAPEVAARVAEAVGARVVDGLDVVTADDVDAVVIASPDDTHATFAVATVEAGKRCLLEKPLAHTIDEARAILAAEVAAGRRLIRVGFMRELDPAHMELAAVVAELGRVTRVRCVHRNVDAQPREVDAIFSQSLVHDFHTIRWLTGREPARITVRAVTRDDGFRDMLVVVELDDGSLATVDFEDHAFAYEVLVEVTATGGMASTLPHSLVRIRRDGTESIAVGADWFDRFEDAYRIEIEEWARTLRDGTVAGPSVWDGYAAQAAAHAAEVALVSGSPAGVHLPDRPALYRDDDDGARHLPGTEEREAR